jgi:hypothetical protein
MEEIGPEFDSISPDSKIRDEQVTITSSQRNEKLQAQAEASLSASYRRTLYYNYAITILFVETEL